MTDREKKLLSDIITSVNLIEDFTREISSFSQYSGDAKTKSAVERHLGIIGEAVGKYLKESDRNHLGYAKQIISLRNRLIHSYDNVDDSIIWSILMRHLGPLKKEAGSLLSP